MIGQEKLFEKINRWKELPRFLILNGTKYSGRKTLAKEIARKFNSQLIFIGIKIDEVREMIKFANESDSDIIFFIDEGNRMSLGAENTLLKVTEEAPNNSHIILSVENKSLLLPTIISRGEVFNMQEYDFNDFRQYIFKNNLLSNEDELKDYNHLCFVYPNLGFLKVLPLEESKKMYDYCEQISKDIRNANGADAFKITEKIKLKDDQEGWDLSQFLYCLSQCCLWRLEHSALEEQITEIRYQKNYLLILYKINKMLSNNLFNKSYILDKLIIDFKSVYFE